MAHVLTYAPFAVVVVLLVGGGVALLFWSRKGPRQEQAKRRIDAQVAAMQRRRADADTDTAVISKVAPTSQQPGARWRTPDLTAGTGRSTPALHTHQLVGVAGNGGAVTADSSTTSAGRARRAVEPTGETSRRHGAHPHARRPGVIGAA